MNFFKGKLKYFNLYKMNEDIKYTYAIKKCYNNISICLNEEEQDQDIEKILKYNSQLYYSFGKRNDKYLYCINGQSYFINDDIDENSQGVNMSDSYINSYEDINLGFLISYNDGNIYIKPAIEGESIGCRKCEIIDDCGDLNKEMNDFISQYIL